MNDIQKNLTICPLCNRKITILRFPHFYTKKEYRACSFDRNHFEIPVPSISRNFKTDEVLYNYELYRAEDNEDHKLIVNKIVLFCQFYKGHQLAKQIKKFMDKVLILK